MGIWLLIFVTAAVLYLLERMSLRSPESYLSVTYRFEKHLAEAGEELKLPVTAENRRFLPVTYLELRLYLPRGLVFLNSDEEDVQNIQYMTGNVIEDIFYLSRYQKLVRSYTFTIRQRGLYRLDGLSCLVGDFLGLKNIPYSSESRSEIVILPKRSARTDISEITGGIIGDISVQRFIMEDPLLVSGFREYTGREPFRAISWNQSLKAGRLIAKTYDHTAENNVTVVLDVENAKGDDLEELLSVARTALEQLTEKGFSWSFTSNAAVFLSRGRFNRIPSGTGDMHLMTVLEGLGRTDGTLRGSFADMLDELISSPVQTSGYLILTAENTPALGGQLRKLRARTACPVRVLFSRKEGGTKL